MVGEIIALQNIREFAGAVPFGSDTNSWPARWFDFVRLADIEDYRVSSEQEKAQERMKS